MKKTTRSDYHVHPNYSIDAAPVPIRDYCLKALELGLREICFTTHVELEPEREALDKYVMFRGEKIAADNEAWLESYFEEIAQAQEEFKSVNLQIRAGVEMGYCLGTEKKIEKILNSYPFDFVLGSIHTLQHIAISSMKESPLYYTSRSLATMRQDYFTTLKEAVASGLFDCIAHVDLYTRYGIRQYGPAVFSVHRGVIEDILAEMKRKKIGLEINTSSLRRGLTEFHPSKEILALAAEAGVEIFTVGSDAHSLEQLGDHVDEAIDLLKEFKLTNHGFYRRKPYPLE